MSRLALARRDRRALVAGGAAVAVLVAASRLVPLWRVWTDDARATAAELTAAVREARAAARLAPALRDSLAARRRRYAGLAPRLVAGDARTAAATLAGVVSGAAGSAHLQLGAVQLRPDSSSGGIFARVSVRGDATGDVRGLAAFIATLERGPRLLAFRELAVSQPDPAAPPDRVEALRLEFVVEGLALRRGGARDSPLRALPAWDVDGAARTGGARPSPPLVLPPPAPPPPVPPGHQPR